MGETCLPAEAGSTLPHTPPSEVILHTNGFSKSRLAHLDSLSNASIPGLRHRETVYPFLRPDCFPSI
jgi:hypothetical protein